MFSVVRTKKKILDRDIKTVSNLWMTAVLTYPICKSEAEFASPVRRSDKPLPQWHTMKYEVLMSGFKTYKLAKAAEESYRQKGKQVIDRTFVVDEGQRKERKEGTLLDRGQRTNEGTLLVDNQLQSQIVEDEVENKICSILAQHIKDGRRSISHERRSVLRYGSSSTTSGCVRRYGRSSTTCRCVRRYGRSSTTRGLRCRCVSRCQS